MNRGTFMAFIHAEIHPQLTKIPYSAIDNYSFTQWHTFYLQTPVLPFWAWHFIPSRSIDKWYMTQNYLHSIFQP